MAEDEISLASLEVALELERSILEDSGFQAACGCTKFVMCQMPGTSWWYATTCAHDTTYWGAEAHWWYDRFAQEIVRREDFWRRYSELLPTVASPYVRIMSGVKLFEVNSSGMVRRRLPGPMTEWK